MFEVQSRTPTTPFFSRYSRCATLDAALAQAHALLKEGRATQIVVTGACGELCTWRGLDERGEVKVLAW